MDILSFFENLPNAAIMVFVGFLCFGFVALGGWGERSIGKGWKVFFSVFGTAVILIGLLGFVFQDFGKPSNLPPADQTATPAGIDSGASFIKPLVDVVTAVLGLFGLALMIMAIAVPRLINLSISLGFEQRITLFVIGLFLTVMLLQWLGIIH
jgi:hypothetical protein